MAQFKSWMIIWTTVNFALLKVFLMSQIFFKWPKINFHLFKSSAICMFKMCIYSSPFFSTMLPTSMCLFSHTFSWFYSLFLWVHWISFSSFSFIFPHLILSTRWLYYKLWESCLIRNMLLPMDLPVLCTPLDFSNEEERYCTWVQWSLSTVLLSAHSFHKLPLLSNQNSELREQDQLG